MSGLGPTSRNLVAAARRGLDPSADVAARVRAKVALAVGAGATMATTTPRAASVAPKAAAIGAGKIVAITAIVGALVTVAWFVQRTPVAATAPAINATSATTDLDPAIDVHVTTAAHADRVIEAAPAPARAHAPAPAQTVPEIKPPSGPPTLAREVELVDTAMASLRADDPANALATLVVYERETAGHGQLAEDAAALEIEARCRSSEAPFADQLKAFDERWPRSVQRARIVTACGNH